MAHSAHQIDGDYQPYKGTQKVSQGWHVARTQRRGRVWRAREIRKSESTPQVFAANLALSLRPFCESSKCFPITPLIAMNLWIMKALVGSWSLESQAIVKTISARGRISLSRLRTRPRMRTRRYVRDLCSTRSHRSGGALFHAARVMQKYPLEKYQQQGSTLGGRTVLQST